MAYVEDLVGHRMHCFLLSLVALLLVDECYQNGAVMERVQEFYQFLGRLVLVQLDHLEPFFQNKVKGMLIFYLVAQANLKIRLWMGLPFKVANRD